jgi:selenide,water dikinase
VPTSESSAEPSPDTEPRLTSLSHGGGCGCKIAPSVLRTLLADIPAAGPFKDLMVGNEFADDAAVWRLNETQALVATTDFFMPIVDDPFTFGRIAATNALSDVYAMGASPIFALAIVGLPVGVLSVETMRAILAGGASVCADAGIPIAGGHSIDSVEPIYGLAAMGLVHPDRVMTNRTARAGDVLILTKPLGVGVLSAALKQGRLDDEGYATLVASTTQLNAVGKDLAGAPGVNAMTDVTGFGLLGHALEMAVGAGKAITLYADDVSVWPQALHLAQQGVRTGASARNWESYGASVTLPPDFPTWRRDLLCDPQTSGGLLISVAADKAGAILAQVRDGPASVQVVSTEAAA